MATSSAVSIVSDLDIVIARQKGREIATELGFSNAEVTVIATAISEVARNIRNYADSGELQFEPVSEDERVGLVVIARDSGPGISDLNQAMQDGYSTIGGLGIGLPGTRRLMDEFEITSEVGTGTTVRMTKWRGGN